MVPFFSSKIAQHWEIDERIAQLEAALKITTPALGIRHFPYSTSALEKAAKIEADETASAQERLGAIFYKTRAYHWSLDTLHTFYLQNYALDDDNSWH